MEDGTTLPIFSAWDFVQRSLQTPDSPTSVLSFMFGVDYEDDAAIVAKMRSGQTVVQMRSLWFSVDPSYDKLCHTFVDLIHAAGQGLLGGEHWDATVDGKMAQLILSDQLARNVFRGSRKAFAYDERSLQLVRSLSESLLGETPNPLCGDVYPPYWVFMLTALMHSESMEDHIRLARIQEHADTRAPPLLCEWFEMMRSGGVAHTQIIERFGRYPHRNAANGRTNTAAEQAWLDDVDNLPSWAKSQLVPST